LSNIKSRREFYSREKREDFKKKVKGIAPAVRQRLEQDGAAFEKALWSEGGFVLLCFISDKALAYFAEFVAEEQADRAKSGVK
jgi:hypothetical protein